MPLVEDLHTSESPPSSNDTAEQGAAEHREHRLISFVANLSASFIGELPSMLNAGVLPDLQLAPLEAVSSKSKKKSLRNIQFSDIEAAAAPRDADESAAEHEAAELVRAESPVAAEQEELEEEEDSDASERSHEAVETMSFGRLIIPKRPPVAFNKSFKSRGAKLRLSLEEGAVHSSDAGSATDSQRSLARSDGSGENPDAVRSLSIRRQSLRRHSHATVFGPASAERADGAGAVEPRAGAAAEAEGLPPGARPRRRTLRRGRSWGAGGGRQPGSPRGPHGASPSMEKAQGQATRSVSIRGARTRSRAALSPGSASPTGPGAPKLHMANAATALRSASRAAKAWRARSRQRTADEASDSGSDLLDEEEEEAARPAEPAPPLRGRSNSIRPRTAGAAIRSGAIGAGAPSSSAGLRRPNTAAAAARAERREGHSTDREGSPVSRLGTVLQTFLSLRRPPPPPPPQTAGGPPAPPRKMDLHPVLLRFSRGSHERLYTHVSATTRKWGPLRAFVALLALFAVALYPSEPGAGDVARKSYALHLALKLPACLLALLASLPPLLADRSRARHRRAAAAGPSPSPSTAPGGRAASRPRAAAAEAWAVEANGGGPRLAALADRVSLAYDWIAAGFSLLYFSADYIAAYAFGVPSVDGFRILVCGFAIWLWLVWTVLRIRLTPAVLVSTVAVAMHFAVVWRRVPLIDARWAHFIAGCAVLSFSVIAGFSEEQAARGEPDVDVAAGARVPAAEPAPRRPRRPRLAPLALPPHRWLARPRAPDPASPASAAAAAVGPAGAPKIGSRVAFEPPPVELPPPALDTAGIAGMLAVARPDAAAATVWAAGPAGARRDSQGSNHSGASAAALPAPSSLGARRNSDVASTGSKISSSQSIFSQATWGVPTGGPSVHGAGGSSSVLPFVPEGASAPTSRRHSADAATGSATEGEPTPTPLPPAAPATATGRARGAAAPASRRSQGQRRSRHGQEKAAAWGAEAPRYALHGRRWPSPTPPPSAPSASPTASCARRLCAPAAAEPRVHAQTLREALRVLAIVALPGMLVASMAVDLLVGHLHEAIASGLLLPGLTPGGKVETTGALLAGRRRRMALVLFYPPGRLPPAVRDALLIASLAWLQGATVLALALANWVEADGLWCDDGLVQAPLPARVRGRGGDGAADGDGRRAAARRGDGGSSVLHAAAVLLLCCAMAAARGWAVDELNRALHAAAACEETEKEATRAGAAALAAAGNVVLSYPVGLAILADSSI
eukprot:tig00000017_g2.t1